MRGIKLVFLTAIILFISWPVGAQDKSSPKVDIPRICIRGVFGSSGDLSVLIDDQQLVKGDLIKGAKIIDITDTSVEFEYQGEAFTKEVGQDCATVVQKIYGGTEGLHKEQEIKKSLAKIFLSNIKGQKTKKEYDAILKERINMTLGTFGLVMFLLYIYFMACLQVIATKLDSKSAWLAWIPLANIFLIFTIANKPLWWIILLFVPAVNIVVSVIIWIAIAQARSKPGWLGVLLLVPLVNLGVLGYLAFSK